MMDEVMRMTLFQSAPRAYTRGDPGRLFHSSMK